MAARKGPPKGPDDPKKRPKLRVVGGKDRKKKPARKSKAKKPAPVHTDIPLPFGYVPADIQPPRKDPRGRDFIIDGPKRRELIVTAQTGMFRVEVAAECGISDRTLTRFFKTCKTAQRKVENRRRLTEWEEELCLFWRSYQWAELQPIKRLIDLAMLKASTPKDALESLGRRKPDLWGKRLMHSNAPEGDEDGEPTRKKSKLEITLDPITMELIRAERRRRGKPDAILKEEAEESKPADDKAPVP